MSRKVADGFYEGAVAVADYMTKVNNTCLNNILNPTRREKYLHGMFMRAMGWTSSLKKLNTNQDFQALVACVRALFEIVVDLSFIHIDKTDSACTKMHLWEESSKLKAAQLLQRYFQNINKPIPEEYHSKIEFIEKNKNRIEKKRIELWPQYKGSHPGNRWTGLNLLKDAKIVDGHMRDFIIDGFSMSLTEFYETEFRQINWYVHGSTLTGIKELPFESFHLICAQSYKWSADLAMLCIKIILTDFQFTKHCPSLQDEWKNLSKYRLMVFDKAYSK